MDKEAILERIAELCDCWRKLETDGNGDIYGECAADLDEIIEAAAEQM